MSAAGTTVYPGIYRSRCVGDTGLALAVYVPQVFGTQIIQITDLTGAGVRPDPGSWGYVAFVGGDTSFPVWISAGGGAGGTTVIDSGANGDLDGGAPDSVYGGLDPIVGGSP